MKYLAMWMQKSNLEINFYFGGCLEAPAGILWKQIMSLHPSSFPLSPSNKDSSTILSIKMEAFSDPSPELKPI